MSDDHDHGARGSDEVLRQKYEHLLHLAEGMRRMLLQMKELVPKAFEEGFRRRVPDHEEPWLVDWLQSDAKRHLDTLLPRPPGPPGRAPDGSQE